MFECWSIAAYLYLRGHRLDEKVLRGLSEGIFMFVL